MALAFISWLVLRYVITSDEVREEETKKTKGWDIRQVWLLKLLFAEQRNDKQQKNEKDERERQRNR